MEAAKFIKQRNRVCGYYNNMPEGCYMCPAFNAAYHKDCEIATDNPERLVVIVEKGQRSIQTNKSRDSKNCRNVKHFR